MSEPARPQTLWDSFTDRVRRDFERKEGARSIIGRDELEVELTPLGRLRWYMNPELADVSDHALYFLELEIPVGSRSGRLIHQGGIVHLVVAGSGHTMFDGARHDWEQLDLIGIPSKPYGVDVQHFNDGPDPVRLLMAFPNFDSSLGPGLSVEVRVTEPAPEYAALAGDEAPGRR